MIKFLFLVIFMFVSNALIMILELVWIRILGPFIGTSIITWSSVIAVILFFMSLGNYYGGKMADTWKKFSYLLYIFLGVSVCILILYYYKNFLLSQSLLYIANIELAVVFISILLFAPASYLLGIISPIVLKIAIDNLEYTGRKFGLLSWVSALGWIFWTLITGFFLIPYFSISMILWMSGMSCIILSLAYAIWFKYKENKSIYILSTIIILGYISWVI